MKRNAVIRIVIWSLVIVCLTSILLAGLGLRSYRSHTVFDRTDAVAATAVTAPVVEVTETITLGKAATVHGSPTEESPAYNELKAGTQVTIQRRENINGRDWAYINAPIQGWILMENPESEIVAFTGPAATVVPTSPPAPEISGSSMLAADISSIDIDWRAGFIQIIPTTGDRIAIEETASDHPLVWKVKNGRLSIDYCEEGRSLGMPREKDLVISVPMDWTCQELDIDAASAQVVIQALTVNSAEIDTASGKTEFVECTVGSLEMETASGDAFFVGSLDTLEFDAASASFTATLANTPRSIEMNSASGSLDLTLPADSGFSVRMEGLKNSFTSDFDTTVQNGAYVHGSGACRIEMESMSGSVYIRKANNA